MEVCRNCMQFSTARSGLRSVAKAPTCRLPWPPREALTRQRRNFSLTPYSRDPDPSTSASSTSPSSSSSSSPSSSSSSSSSSSTTSYPSPSEPLPPQDVPRWLRTPQRMVAPVSLRSPKPHNEWQVNEDPARLNAFYNRLLGPGGDKLLSEEVKWLAVTHKSFDQGRRGYNDRLAFLGKRIINLQASYHLLQHGSHPPPKPHPDPSRQAVEHPDLERLPHLTELSRVRLTWNQGLTSLADSMGALGVLRWRPRSAADLKWSGSASAMSQALCAIIGAIALQRGGEVAAQIVRQRILPTLASL